MPKRKKIQRAYRRANEQGEPGTKPLRRRIKGDSITAKEFSELIEAKKMKRRLKNKEDIFKPLKDK